MKLSVHQASDADLALLAEWNHQLIRDEGHRNPMTVEQLAVRMKEWLRGDYQAVVFSSEGPVGYALFKQEESLIYLRHFFVRRDRRRAGIGRTAFGLLRREVWPPEVRLLGASAPTPRHMRSGWQISRTKKLSSSWI